MTPALAGLRKINLIKRQEGKEKHHRAHWIDREIKTPGSEP